MKKKFKWQRCWELAPVAAKDREIPETRCVP